MFIRSIITTSALVVLFGLTAGSAFADNSTNNESYVPGVDIVDVGTADNFGKKLSIFADDGTNNESYVPGVRIVDIETASRFESDIPDHVQQDLESN